jgi:nitrile hydratase beta subunit
MNGAHDLGGMMGFGAIAPEANEPVFHSAWERRVFAMFGAVSSDWSIDDDRAACEAMSPAAYLETSYYEHWLHGLETLLVARGFVSLQELAAGRPSLKRKNVAAPMRASEVWARVREPGSYLRPAPAAPRFKSGEKVRARNIHPATHTRLPRYVRDRIGEITHVHGPHVFPDSNATGRGEDPRWLYAVTFSARELWGHDNADTVTLDLWEPYLEPA